MRGLSALLLASAALALAGACGGSPARRLAWYRTCGDPVGGRGHRPSGLPGCTTETAGAACAAEGAECDPNDPANVYLLCSATDPRQGPGACPISRAAYKKDIRFLADEDLRRYRDELLALPLATWRYRDAPAGSPLHLGFLIDGHESLACVEPGRDQVDLYGYASMAVAALQLQARELAELRKEVDALRAGRRTGGERPRAAPPPTRSRDGFQQAAEQPARAGACVPEGGARRALPEGEGG